MKLIEVLQAIPMIRVLNNYRCSRKWRAKNNHNFTTIGSRIFDFDCVEVGKGSYGELNVIQFEKHNGFLKIGNYCSIAPEVVFLLDGEHRYDTLTSYPFKARFFNESGDAQSKGCITLGDDVWIGYSAIIISGVHIGQGAVVAAGAVVTKDVPPYAIVGGVPAKVIKYRFEPKLIEELLKIDYNKLTKEVVEAHVDELYIELTDEKQLDWMPKKKEIK